MTSPRVPSRAAERVGSLIVLKTIGRCVPATDASISATTEAIFSDVSVKGRTSYVTDTSGNLVSRLRAIVSAVNPVWSDTQKTGRTSFTPRLRHRRDAATSR